jgi:hypothetical protein
VLAKQKGGYVLTTQTFGKRSARNRLGTQTFRQANDRDDNKKAVHKSALETGVMAGTVVSAVAPLGPRNE